MKATKRQPAGREPLRSPAEQSPFRADDFLALRFPVLPAGLLDELAELGPDQLADALRRRLQDPYLREALYLASPSLFQRACQWELGDGSFNDLPKTIARYVLRMAYRATPFGTFSCVAGCRAATGGRPTSIDLPSRPMMRRIVQLDSTALSRFAQQAQSDRDVRASLRYAPNDTILVSGDAISFTAYLRNRRGKRVYRRVEVERSIHLDRILSIAKPGLTVAQIVSLALPLFKDEATADELGEFVWELVDTQVLCSDQLVDITSANPLENLARQLPEQSPLRIGLDRLGKELDSLSGTSPVAIPDGYASVIRMVSDAGVKSDGARSAKVDLFGDSEQGVVGADVLRSVELVVNSLVPITRKNSRLVPFAKRFSERFGDSEAPLLMVADELESLGFSEKDASTPELARAVKALKKTRRTPAGTSTSALLDKLVGAVLNHAGGEYADITSVVDGEAPTPARPAGADSTLVAWLALWRRPEGQSERPVVELKSIGSQDPGRVMGRFAHGVPSIRDYLLRSAQDPGEIVAEIVHLPEDRLGNISGRPVTAEYEVRLRGGESVGATGLPLDDLMVSVANERVLIRSRSLGRYVRLRMSSAHAFDNADALPIYRFMNHVSNQDYTAEAASLRRHLPKAAFVPGIRYRDVIVSRPTWQLSADVIRRLKQEKKEARLSAFAGIRAELGLPNWVALVQGDNIIPYRLDSAWMVEDLVRTMLRSEEVTLTDVRPMGMEPFLASGEGPHFHELQLALRSSGRRPADPSRTIHAPFTETVVPVWGRWAYFKIYVSPHLQDAVLASLRPVLDRLVASSPIHRYFFIRYRDDAGAHLRLRLDWPEGCALGPALPALKPVLEELQRRRQIQDVKIEAYVRETSRYGGDEWCGHCEDIFCVDSKAILEALPHLKGSWGDSWRTAALGIDAMLSATGIESLADRLGFARIAARDFDAEMQFGSEERKKIGEMFATSSPLLVDGVVSPDIPGAAAIQASIAPIRSIWKRAIASAADPAPSDGHLYRIRWSLIHMRLNRLFNSEARLQEAIVWEMLKRSYASQLHRAQAVKNPVEA